MIKSKIVLLGGTGFVGQNVAEILTENHLNFDIISKSKGCDLRDIGQVKKALSNSKPDFIINCAAHVGSLNYVTEQAASVISDNSRMIMSIYEGIANISPNSVIINPIANCAYPAKAETFIEDNWWDGHLHRSVLSYGATRRLIWAAGESFQMQYGIRSINLLVPNMYGPYDSTDPNKAHALNALISKFVKAKNTGQDEITIWGTGVAIREWLYAKDFGKIVMEIIRNPNMPGLSEPLNIAQNFGLSVKELVDIITKAFDYKGKIIWDTSMPDGAPKKVMDDRKFKKIFPAFSFTSLETGISNAIRFYQNSFPY